MPNLRDLYLIDARISYLEQVLAALGLINPGDPAPSDISRLGGAQFEAFRWPGPIVDPAVTDRVRLAESLLRRPPQGDPASRYASAAASRPNWPRASRILGPPPRATWKQWSQSIEPARPRPVRSRHPPASTVVQHSLTSENFT
jgi:hypothetical protein